MKLRRASQTVIVTLMKNSTFMKIALSLMVASPAFAERIEDNSFLIEEAYNQEAGTVQHIFNYQHKTQGMWQGSYTLEAPVGSMRHQLSVQVPVARTANSVDASGLGDVMLNYRRQLLSTEQVAVAPRLTAILPSGDSKRGLGAGAPGVQFNLPVSVVLDQRWVTHVNVGLTHVPKSKNTSGAKSNATSGTFGASLVHLTTDEFNLMGEFVVNTVETTSADDTVDRSVTMIFNPGFRYAVNIQDFQIVFGAALPIEMVPGGGAVNQFYYLSFEYPLAMLN